MISPSTYRRGFDELKAGNYEEAKRLFADAERKAGTTAETLGTLRTADQLLAEGDVAQSAKLYQLVLDRNPTLPEVYIGLARLSLFVRQPDAARTHALAATRLAPNVGRPWMLLGLAAELQGRLDDAVAHVAKAVDLSPSDALCQLNYGRLLLATGRADEAIDALTGFVGLEPLNVDALTALGVAHRQLRHFEKAIALLERAKDAAPKRLEGYVALIEVLMETHSFAVARAIAEQGLSRCGEHPALLESAVGSAIMVGDVEGAIALLRRQVKVAPRHEQAALNLATLCLSTGKHAESEAVARALVERNPRCWQGWVHLGTLFDSTGQDAKAEEAYRRAVVAAPEAWQPLANLGAMLVQSPSAPKHKEAETALARAAAMAPASEWRITYNLALAKARLGDKDRALELARDVLARWPQHEEAQQQARTLEKNLTGMAKAS